MDNAKKGSATRSQTTSKRIHCRNATQDSPRNAVIMPAGGAKPTSAAGEHALRGASAEDSANLLRAEASPFKPGQDIPEAGAATSPLSDPIATVETRATINYNWSCAAPTAEGISPW